MTEYTPRFYTTEEKVLVDDFEPGVLAGNPVSKPSRPAVENIVAKGFGSATDMESSENQNLEGSGAWQADRWSVVIRRALQSDNRYDVSFREGGVTPVSFAVWDGSEGHRGGSKAVSTWYYVGLETEERAATYILPVFALIVAAGIEGGIILWIRKRRG
jgi:hypothetical protein